jgi:GxxExxY protein
MGYLYEELTGKVIGCFYRVFDELRGGFLESVYEQALLIELMDAGLQAENQKKVDVFYKTQKVGDFKADVIVEEKIIIEVKAISDLLPVHEAQLLNYLRATNMKLGLLVNFGAGLKFRRMINSSA